MRTLKITILTAFLLIIFMVSVLIATGCSSRQNADDAVSSQIGIRGRITDIKTDGENANIRVEGAIEDDTVYDKAQVRIDPDTMIQKDEMSRLFEIPDLKIGDRVEVIFKGAVAESYPVQGTAAIVRIITK